MTSSNLLCPKYPLPHTCCGDARLHSAGEIIASKNKKKERKKRAVFGVLWSAPHIIK